MAWTSPMTAVANSVFTAAQFNTYVRDNLNETMPALATEAGQYFVSDGPHSLVARKIAFSTITTSNQVINATQANITGGSVTVTTGREALIHISARLEMSNNNNAGRLSFDVSGASNLDYGDDHEIQLNWDGVDGGQASRQGTWGTLKILTPGSNTFTMHGHVNNGTLTVNYAQIIVIPLS